MNIHTYVGLLDTHLAQAAELGAALTLADISALVGILTGLLSALVNVLYTWRKDRREQRESDAAWARRRDAMAKEERAEASQDEPR